MQCKHSQLLIEGHVAKCSLWCVTRTDVWIWSRYAFVLITHCACAMPLGRVFTQHCPERSLPAMKGTTLANHCGCKVGHAMRSIVVAGHECRTADASPMAAFCKFYLLGV